MSLAFLQQLALFGLLLAAYDRISGWVANGLKRLVLTVLLAAAFRWLVPLPWPEAAWLSVGVFTWRTHAEVRHAGWADVLEVFVRHAKYALLGLFPVLHFLLHTPLWLTAGLLLAFAAVAALLARANLAFAERGFDQNMVVELLRGAVLGLAVGGALATL